MDKIKLSNIIIDGQLYETYSYNSSILTMGMVELYIFIASIENQLMGHSVSTLVKD